MPTRGSSDPAVEAMVGYAADADGHGVLYARLTGAQAKWLLRFGFRVARAAPAFRSSDWLRRVDRGLASVLQARRSRSAFHTRRMRSSSRRSRPGGSRRIDVHSVRSSAMRAQLICEVRGANRSDRRSDATGTSGSGAERCGMTFARLRPADLPVETDALARALLGCVLVRD